MSLSEGDLKARARRMAGFVVVGGAIFTASFMNCSKSGFKIRTHESFQMDQASDSGDVISIEKLAFVTAYQDQDFKALIPGFKPQTTVIDGLPTWAAVNLATGEISGTPTTFGNFIGFQREVAGGIATGTFAVQVVGDPFKAQQWHLTNTGQTGFAGSPGTPGADIHLIDTIRSKILGEGIRVAISDSGVLEEHPNLKPNLLAGSSRNYTNDFVTTQSWLGDSTPDVTMASDAHGTAVAGIIAERGWLGTGGRGVAPLASWAGFLFIPAQEILFMRGLLSVAYLDQYAGDFDVYNYSWGDLQCHLSSLGDSDREALRDGAFRGRNGKGSIYSKAAGNEFIIEAELCDSTAEPTDIVFGNVNMQEETTTPYMINVVALNAKSTSATYSSPGAANWISAPGGEVGLDRLPETADPDAAPVVLSPAILTTDFSGCMSGLKTAKAKYNNFDAGKDPNTRCNHTAGMNGTSAAAPVFSGVAALLLSANPNLTWRDVKHIVASTADQVDPSRTNIKYPLTGEDPFPGYIYEPGWVTNAAGYKFHNWYGFGRVNVDKAVAMAKTYTSALGTFKETNVVNASGTSWKYTSGNLGIPVPSLTPAGVTRTLAVTENYVIEAVQVRLSADSCIGFLGVELISPSGTKSVLLNVNSLLRDPSMVQHTMLSNAFYGERSVGNWTLRLVSGTDQCATTWRDWQLNIIGH